MNKWGAVRARGVPKVVGGMNKTEAAYRDHLALRERKGEVAWFVFEGVKLRLADNTFYTPDFSVMLRDGEIEMHEVKGRSGVKYWCEDDAKVKIKVAASIYPFLFKIVWPKKGSGWDVEDMKC